MVSPEVKLRKARNRDRRDVRRDIVAQLGLRNGESVSDGASSGTFHANLGIRYDDGASVTVYLVRGTSGPVRTMPGHVTVHDRSVGVQTEYREAIPKVEQVKVRSWDREPSRWDRPSTSTTSSWYGW